MTLRRLFSWQVLRDLTRHRLLALLSALSIAIGVAVYLAVQLANASANRAFASAIDLVAGKAQLEISSPSENLPDENFPLLEKTPGVAAATPLVRGLVGLSDFPGEYLDILGLDIFTNIPFRTFELTDYDGSDFDLTGWLAHSDAIAVSQSFAAQHRLHRGDRVRIQLDGREDSLVVAFILKGAALAGAGDHFAAMDLGWAQELFRRRGYLSSIQVQFAPGADRRAIERDLRTRLPGNLEIATPSRRSEQVDQMLASFQLNLTAMSLVSLLVGAFLIYNAASASVVRRRREIGILRALGTSRAQIRAIFLGQALVAALVGTALGLWLGTLLSRSLLGAVSGTVSSLYALIDVRHVALDPRSYFSAAILGLVSALLAAWFPANSAAAIPPVLALHPDVAPERSSRISGWSLVFALVCALVALLTCMAALRTGPAWLSFLAAFFTLASASFLAPIFISFFPQLVRRFVPRRFFSIRLASSNFRRSLSRNAVTVAALSCAVAMASAVSVMIFSFRETVTEWIGQTLVADLFVTPAANEIAGPVSFLPDEALRFFQQHSDVAAVDTYRQIEINFRDHRIAFAGIRADGARSFPFLAGDRKKLMARFRHERGVIVSESLARRFHLAVGDTFEVPATRGVATLPIIAIFFDYTRDQGIAFTNAANFTALFQDSRINSIGIYLRRGRNGENVAAAFRANFSRRGEFAIYSNTALRRRAFEIFEQTFAITFVLRAIAIIVAVIGIFLSFITLVAERSRLFGVMRALGTSGGQIRRVIIVEAVLVAATASLLGLLAGVALAEVLTDVVNRAFFGWTIRLNWPWLTLGLTPLWLIVAAVAAALIPAYRAGRKSLAEDLRTE